MKRLWLLFSQTVTIVLAAYFVVATLKPHWIGSSPSMAGAVALIEAAPAAAGATPAGSFRTAAQKHRQRWSASTPARRAPATPHSDPWFRFFFGEQGQPAPGGPGQRRDRECRRLHPDQQPCGGGRRRDRGHPQRQPRRARAKVIGTDPDTDLAMLKIDPRQAAGHRAGQLRRCLQVGDQVLAIGNPFGVGQTVTSGIVSALGRNQLGINTFENFIQTDAAINPGNSGGALVDTNGNLLGINTAIYSRSGGSMGIGFAIPVSTAKHGARRHRQRRAGYPRLDRCGAQRTVTRTGRDLWCQDQPGRDHHRRAAKRPCSARLAFARAM
jgi:serine protease DegQ